MSFYWFPFSPVKCYWCRQNKVIDSLTKCGTLIYRAHVGLQSGGKWQRSRDFQVSKHVITEKSVMKDARKKRLINVHVARPPLDDRGWFACATGATRKNGELFTVPHEIRAGTIVANFAHVDENIQVNGYAFVLDMTGIGAKHLAHWSSDDMRKWGSCWEVGTHWCITVSIDLFTIYVGFG